MARPISYLEIIARQAGALVRHDHAVLVTTVDELPDDFAVGIDLEHAALKSRFIDNQAFRSLTVIETDDRQHDRGADNQDTADDRDVATGPNR